jgi:hypothetical protein
MKATVRAFNKPPKTTKTTKNIPLTDNNDPSQPEKPALKRGRKKKEVQVVTNFQDDFVAEIVALANDRVVSNQFQRPSVQRQRPSVQRQRPSVQRQRPSVQRQRQAC